MRICILSEAYPPTDGGVATSAQRIARTLHQEGVEVHLCTFDHSRPIESPDYCCKENDSGIHINRFGPFFLKHPDLSLNEKTKAIFRRRVFDQMVQHLRMIRPDLIFSMYLLNAGFLATFIARTLAIPHIAGIRGNDIGRNVFDVERFGTIQWILTAANATVSVNEHLLTRQRITFPETLPKAHVIPNSIPPAHPPSAASRAQGRERLNRLTGWYTSELLITFIGSLREKKGIQPLAEALELLYEREIPFRFLLIGPEPSKASLLLAGPRWKKLQDANRIFTSGYMSRSEVQEMCLGCDVVCMPSLDDGMANGLLEGMQQELCPVASDLFADVVSSGRNGFLVPRGQPAPLADALQMLEGDRALCRQMGEAARLSLEAYSPQDEAKAYVTLFQSLLSGDR